MAFLSQGSTLDSQVTLETIQTPLSSLVPQPLTLKASPGAYLGNWIGDILCTQKGFSAIQDLGLGLGTLWAQSNPAGGKAWGSP